jgi:hypothetical protein
MLKGLFEDESREERLERLFKILKATTEEKGFDEGRALKTIEKIKGVRYCLLFDFFRFVTWFIFFLFLTDESFL